MKLILTQPRITIAAALATTVWLTCPDQASAQTMPDSEIAGEQPQEDENYIAIGAGAAYMPAHHGADEYRFQPLPAIDARWGPFFVNFQNGIGLNIVDSEVLTIGVGLVPTDGYRAADVPVGVGKLSTGLGARGFVNLRQFGFEATVGVTQVVTGGTEGMIVEAELSYPIFVSQRLMLIPSVGTSWGDRQNNDRYFGITAAQSAASGLPEFRPGSGFIDMRGELGAMYRLTDRIGIGVIGGVTSLMSDVRDSPIVEHRTRPFGIMFVTYRF